MQTKLQESEMYKDISTKLCEKHAYVKTKNSQGRLLCKFCVTERNKLRLAQNLENGVFPKPCKRCGSERKWDTFGQAVCPSCSSDYNKEWSTLNLEKKRSYDKNYYKDNKETISIKSKTYRNENKELLKRRQVLYMSNIDKEYWVWKQQNARCHNPTSSDYKNYGGRGISVFEEWRRDATLSKDENYARYLKFKKYIDEVLGLKPSSDHSIDRINNNSGYEPGNLKWSDRTEQNNNKRNNIDYKKSIPENSPIYYPDNKLITLKEFSEITKLPLIVVKYRYAQNWDAEWILSNDWDNRDYEYNGYSYNKTELSLFSGIPYKRLEYRFRDGWSVKQALEGASPWTKSNKNISDIILETVKVLYQEKEISLQDLSNLTGVPLSVLKYRYKFSSGIDWLIGKDFRSRNYFYKNNWYTTTELSILSDLPYTRITDRLSKKWTVERTLETPIKKAFK